MNAFEREIRRKLKSCGPENKVFLKTNYRKEIFASHGISEAEIDLLFDMKKIEGISSHPTFDDRILVRINVNKKRTIELIFKFVDGKIGIITAYVL